MDFLDNLTDRLAKMNGGFAAVMVSKVANDFCFDDMPEALFSTFIFGQIDAYYNRKDDKEEAVYEMISQMLKAASETYELERRMKNESNGQTGV